MVRAVATDPQAPDRNLAMELVRTTEAAAMAASRWMGRGDKVGADGAAVEAMRVVLSSVQMDGIVVIGEGEKDNAPMLFNGERIGDGSPPRTDIAVDPIDGTTPTALGRGGALAVIAVSERGTMFDPGPCVYMEKLAVGPRAKGACDIRRSPTENLHALSLALVVAGATGIAALDGCSARRIDPQIMESPSGETYDSPTVPAVDFMCRGGWLLTMRAPLSFAFSRRLRLYVM